MINQEITQPPLVQLEPSYDPAKFELKLYDFWEKSNCFDSTDINAQGQKPFCMVIPPPNITGVLHMGHALSYTIQDILTRWRRMKGDNTLWLPGTDHAGIATQALVEKALAKEPGPLPSRTPLNRHDLGRKAFLERVWKWKEEHGSQIQNQLKKLGCSLDWKRERFTLDPEFSESVREVFVRLYEKGLIYRGDRIINWCPRCQTALSDLEVIPTERAGFLWHIAYRVIGATGKPIIEENGSEARVVVATTRPETYLGDAAVAVNPNDKRFHRFIGKFLELPLLKRSIPLIQDNYVDSSFGSGALKVTPAHDFNDYELGQRHQLPSYAVMGKDGKITSLGGPFAGLRFEEARLKILEELKKEGVLVKADEIVHQVGLCQRCEHIAEPMISLQWFVRVAPLAIPAIAAVKDGRIVFTPKNWEKTYFDWMNNIRDWCISRQLVWGHQIPAWICRKCQGVTVQVKAPEGCNKCGASAENLKQDEDVLDTWFSSALWPFATLGWPKSTEALETFYPTTILETGFDIIFFWVARMIMMGLHFTGQVPFSKVYLHAMVRDEKGEKMSKSKGNVIDPLEIIRHLGADPLRFTLISMAGQGRDIKLSLSRVEGYHAFCNKLWNATRFFLLHLDQIEKEGKSLSEPEGGLARWIYNHRIELVTQNRWIIHKLQGLIEKVERNFENYELDVAAKSLYEFTWHEFCDWFIEFSKLPLKEGEETRNQTLYVYHFILENLLCLLHPIIPFVTERLWQSLPWKRAANTPGRNLMGKPEVMTLMLQPFPEFRRGLTDHDSEYTIAALKMLIQAIRNFRGENNISPKIEFSVKYWTVSEATDAFVRLYNNDVKALSRISDIERDRREGNALEQQEAVISLTTPPMELRINLQGLVNIEEETKRLKKEIERINSDLAHVSMKLVKDSFLMKAPREVVEQERKKEEELVARRREQEEALHRLSRLVNKT